MQQQTKPALKQGFYYDPQTKQTIFVQVVGTMVLVPPFVKTPVNELRKID